MDIHKIIRLESKGLEFPVVFVCGMGKKFNQSDARAKLILHPDYGIGPEYIDYNSVPRLAWQSHNNNILSDQKFYVTMQ